MTPDALTLHLHSLTNTDFTIVLFERLSDDRFLLSVEHLPTKFRAATVEHGSTDAEIRGVLRPWCERLLRRVKDLPVKPQKEKARNAQ